MTATIEKAPALSECRNLYAFFATTKYPAGPAGAALFYSDHELVGRLAEAVRLAAVAGVETLADLGEQRVNVVVGEHECVHYGAWTGPEAGPGVLAKLDVWFAPRQAAYEAQREIDEERMARYVEHAAELDREVGESLERANRALWGLPRATI